MYTHSEVKHRSLEIFLTPRYFEDHVARMTQFHTTKGRHKQNLRNYTATTHALIIQHDDSQLPQTERRHRHP